MSNVEPEPVVLRGAHASSLHALGTELSALHQQMLRTGHDELGPVRTAMLTLVTVCNNQAVADAAEDVVRRLATHHPSRVILVVADHNATPEGVDADLALECLPMGGAEQICAETVRLTVRGEPALHLVSVVTPLLLPDVPVVLWLAGAPRLQQALHSQAVAICERIVLDSDAYPDPLGTLRTLDDAQLEHGHLPIGDLAWARLHLWRELLATSFDSHDMQPFLRGIDRVAVSSCGDHPSAEAWLLVGWLSSRLGWDEGTTPPITVSAQHADVAYGTLVSVHLHCTVDGHTAEVSVERSGECTETSISHDGGLRAKTTMRTPARDLFALVGRQLQESGEDAVYVDAVREADRIAALLTVNPSPA